MKASGEMGYGILPTMIQCRKDKKIKMQTLTLNHKHVRFLRYPGGKQRMLAFLLPLLPTRDEIDGRYFEPFLGGGAVFFSINPKTAVLSDKNNELINLYQSLRLNPDKVWGYFEAFPDTKEAYYSIRSKATGSREFRAARTLYLNRTCFKGMWRYNASGMFNVGYGGQERRWAISQKSLHLVSDTLSNVTLLNEDFEEVIRTAQPGDFIFLDPPYKPGAKEMDDGHYQYGCFSYKDQVRLANVLREATKRSVKWAMTTSSHPDILRLYAESCKIIQVPHGTGTRLGIIDENPEEVVIKNY
jgi:DNA adenine methylase